MEPRYNEPLYNEVLGITIYFLYSSNSKIYEKKISIKRNLVILACYIIASPLAIHYIEVPLLMLEICPEMHALAKMAEMAINRQNRQTINKIQMRWQRGPLQSGDFGENGVFGENGRNGA